MILASVPSSSADLPILKVSHLSCTICKPEKHSEDLVRTLWSLPLESVFIMPKTLAPRRLIIKTISKVKR